MKTFVLCGGLGTRLREVIGSVQKTVAEVGGRPFLAQVVDQLVKAGLDDIVFCAGYQALQVEQAAASLALGSSVRTVVIRETAPLGTAGAVRNAIAVLHYEGPLVVINGDTLVDSEAYRLAASAPAPVLVAAPVEDCLRYGSLVIDNLERVVSVTEKGVGGPGWISAGVYGLLSVHFQGLGEGPASLEQDVIPALVKGGTLNAARYRGPFIDIGTPESLRQIRGERVTEVK